MEKKQAQEDLRFIRQMMEESRQAVADNGMHYINWSIMPILGIIGTYLVLMTGAPVIYIFWIWGAVVTGGWIISFFIGAKEFKKRTMNFAEKILTSVWIASGITMAIIAFAGMISQAFSPHLIPAFIAVIAGIPFYIAGIVYDLNWFKWISAGWWIAGIAFFFWNSFHTLAVLGGLIILFQVIPGTYLYIRFGSHRQKLAE